MQWFYKNWFLTLLIGIPLIILLSSLLWGKTSEKAKVYSDNEPGTCLVIPEKYCKSGKAVEADGEFIGVGFTLPEGTGVFSDKDGDLSKTDYEIMALKYPSASVDSGSSSYVTNYIFIETGATARAPQTGGSQKISKGKEIGRVSSESLGMDGDYNLVVFFASKDANVSIPAADKTLTLKTFGL